MKTWTSLQLISVCAIFFCLVSACNPSTATPPSVLHHPQLRIVNAGSEDIIGLVVIFPRSFFNSEPVLVEFGDVPAGSTTEYQDVPGGVYRYAAYDYMLNGEVLRQPVIDWVGEVPLAGEKFTYRIEFDLEQEPYAQIRLLGCTVDVPQEMDAGCLLMMSG